METTVEKAPQNYEEWMELLRAISQSPVEETQLSSVERGRLMEGEHAALRLQPYVVKTVDQMLRLSVRSFNHNLKLSIEENDLEVVPVLCGRLKKEMQYCFFFQNMKFLNLQFVQELSDSLEQEIRTFWGKEVREFTKITEETEAPEIEELVIYLKRLQRRN